MRKIAGIVAMFGTAFVPIGQGSVVIKGKTLDEALARVPCRFISKDGTDLKVSNVPIVIDESAEPNSLILTNESEIGPIKKRCFSKR
ncbi:hypothetical protein [Bradyrhizobium sp.]|jgi:hypothetical protein|uniref:hypothetical protein n=1 Tax=Bradyrhizobium sp. TaxID=376 RepID=UPI003C14F2AA